MTRSPFNAANPRPLDVPPAVAKRFWSFVSPTEPDECWEWRGPVTRSGYGSMCVEGASHGAHRVSWALANGPIPPNRVVMHSCDYRLCVNPRHLSVGSPKDNVRDMVKKGRNRSLTHHRERLVESLRERIAELESALLAYQERDRAA